MSPTIVLVHGSFADASGWNGVVNRLQAEGYTVYCPPNLLRNIPTDAAYIRDFLSTIEGDIVLVGHSYGGAVITTAGNHEKVVALVYVAGYALDEGETLGELQGRFPDPPLAANLRYAPFPVAGGEPGTDVSIDPDAFPHIFAADVPIETTRFMALAQRPLSAAAFTEPSGPPAWRSKPAWGMVSGADTAINPDVERFGYERAEMTVTEVEGASHAVFLSHPGAVAAVIREAIVAVVPVA